ncbi:hypothetical protein TrLO_g13234 [Triparma laevis f. longispina]|uniref:Dynamin-type G domain-containing protein n=1 Tax=Triparma laevis f. longispina TaxID=1714387 RepID=A0A9W7FAJ6_9STRA|nr:hypothetical protein TrLO_g13234 [Triparma laevis f. longispina]
MCSYLFLLSLLALATTIDCKQSLQSIPNLNRKLTLNALRGGSSYESDNVDLFDAPETSYDSYDDPTPASSTDNNTSRRMEERSAQFIKGEEKGALYDAYNLLHTLAQDFQKPFDAPAVLVVGHQSSGKSALIEALMGFQFNQVGGGTKTRRPVALRMQYNPKCDSPSCFLQGDDGVECPKSLGEIQEYIESENSRLEHDPVRCFDSREINIRMEYKFCPNLILIDTPGLIAAPKTPKGSQANMQSRALQASAKEAEKLVIAKMRCKDYIILCVEDTADWKHGQTREIVQKADPDLSRTVIVNTKLDTKIPQFGDPEDVEEFLKAPLVSKLAPHKLGGPFFTSVPSGRVGSGDSYLFRNDEEFVSSCANNEDADREVVKKRLTAGPHVTKALLPRVGISRLRGFLERRVDECYRRNVAKIVPLLQAEHAAAAKRLEVCEAELESLSIERLKSGADAFCDGFCAALKEAIHGSVVAPPSTFGETLSQENLAAGSFHDRCAMAVSERGWERLVVSDVGNRDHRLYGGSQYHRALREFSLATKCLRLPTITEDEVANAAGVGDTHDGVNFLRAACVIAVEKARTSFDPLLDSLKLRTNHIMDNLFPVAEYMLRQKMERQSKNKGANDGSEIITNPQFRELVKTIFENFIEECSESCMRRCRDDLTALTRYITWDLNERSSGALRRSLPDQGDIVSVYQVAVASNEKAKKSDIKAKHEEAAVAERALVKPTDYGNRQVSASPNERERDYYNLLQLMEEAACARDANRTNLVVSGLVQHIVAQWRESFGKSVCTKFNCFYLLPFVEEFQRHLRSELQRVYEGDMTHIFDLDESKRVLQRQVEDLKAECTANKRLQEKFDSVSQMLQEQQKEGGGQQQQQQKQPAGKGSKKSNGRR